MPGDILLVDSGGQYPDGTTDVTRTLPMGAGFDPAARRPYTRVLQGMIGLARARFPRGVAGAHLDALARLRAGGGNLVCNVGYAKGFSVLDVVEVVKRVSGVDFRVSLSDRRAGDPAEIVASNDRIRRELGWKPKYDDLYRIVRSALDWERRLHNLPAGDYPDVSTIPLPAPARPWPHVERRQRARA